jgi:hypothetical protein
MVMDADALRDAANLADDVPVDEYLEVKKLRRAVRDLYYRMSR